VTEAQPDHVPGDRDLDAVPAGHPAAFHDGAAHIIRWANPPFLALFGDGVVGLPAREAMTGFGRVGFELMDRVLREGRPLARRVGTPSGELRLVVVPRVDVETGVAYGVATHLRAETNAQISRLAGRFVPHGTYSSVHAMRKSAPSARGNGEEET
jgi:hypothetical protein